MERPEGILEESWTASLAVGKPARCLRLPLSLYRPDSSRKARVLVTSTIQQALSLEPERVCLPRRRVLVQPWRRLGIDGPFFLLPPPPFPPSLLALPRPCVSYRPCCLPHLYAVTALLYC